MLVGFGFGFGRLWWLWWLWCVVWFAVVDDG
jgi:hypothetical protein